MRTPPLVNSYFSGCGMMDLGLQNAGLEIQQSFEIDTLCCATQRANFKHAVNECDITKKLVLTDLECDVMVGTYPCTKYSAIADIHGTRSGDDLFLHYFRHVAIKQPEIYTMENVPGMRKFPVVMEAMTRLPDYYVQVFCPIASQTWLPQKRLRLIIVGSKRRFQWRPPVEGKKISLAAILESNPQIEIPEYVYKRINGHYRDMPIICDPAKGDIAPTCVAHYSKDVSTRLVVDSRYPKGLRPFSVREYARLQGLPDTFKFIGGDRASYKMIGNGVSVPVGEWLGREILRYFRQR